ncbi:FAD-dependent oxidoreductase [Ampullimonas aquatilis]|uniref:FAD-dependent oxidoreductase n=1 Tax=Ampullimonas aquatilis TaxID=1341549 RepID=UPI003C70B7EB
MKIAVVGAGIIGMNTAYYLARDGHTVTVYDRCNAPAQEASFAHGGILCPSWSAPWSKPASLAELVRHLSKKSQLQFVHGYNSIFWNWLGKWLKSLSHKQYPAAQAQLYRLSRYSLDCLDDIIRQHHIELDQRRGCLQLYRKESDLDLAQADLIGRLGENGGSRLDRNASYKLVPTLSEDMDMVGGIWQADAISGNGALLAKTLKQICDDMDVRFQLGQTVSVRLKERRGQLMLGKTPQDHEAIVIAAGMGSLDLLRRLKIRIPLLALRGYSATLPLRHPELLPAHALLDTANGVNLTPLGNHLQARLRVSAMTQLVLPDHQPSQAESQAAFDKLTTIAHEWHPYPVDYNRAAYWTGLCPVTPHGLPVVGATARANVFLNIGHGQLGWSLAAGCGKMLADTIAQRKTMIDPAGLILA